MKKVSTFVKTGDILEDANGTIFTIGLLRKVDGKNKIEVCKYIDKTSCITLLMSTRALNNFLKDKTIIGYKSNEIKRA